LRVIYPHGATISREGGGLSSSKNKNHKINYRQEGEKVNTYTDEQIQEIKKKAHREGAQEALEWLEEVYEDISQTGAWAEYMDEKEEECAYCEAGVAELHQHEKGGE
jgi:gamma-glutamyl:cysteine ligase YbdK (ATP-grasp superfamily)